MGSGEHPVLPNSTPVTWGLGDTAWADRANARLNRRGVAWKQVPLWPPFSDSGTTQYSCQSNTKHHCHQFLLISLLI